LVLRSTSSEKPVDRSFSLSSEKTCARSAGCCFSEQIDQIRRGAESNQAPDGIKDNVNLALGHEIRSIYHGAHGHLNRKRPIRAIFSRSIAAASFRQFVRESRAVLERADDERFAVHGFLSCSRRISVSLIV
jgi:hypothetical protein